jgi:putative transposase
MARLPRLYVPDIPQLAQAEFLRPLGSPADPAPASQLDMLLEWLREEARSQGVALHGWLLLSDRVTLLATPGDDKALSRLIQGLGRRMAAGMQHGRVFRGRYRSALVQPGAWVLPAMVWLESLPVPGHYVDTAARWPWSSAAAHAGLPASGADLLTDHPDYWNLGNTPFARQAGYRQMLEQGLGSSGAARIRDALFGQWALGEAAFLDQIRDRASRRIAPAPRGRPRKSQAVSEPSRSENET